MRLGFAVRVLGQRGLRVYDTRRPQHAPHLSVSLAHLRDVFAYLATIDVAVYRMASELAPFATHPHLPQFHDQIAACAAELAAVGAQARTQRLRLSFHAPLHVQLGTADAALRARSIEELQLLAALLDGMQLDQDALVVVHVGGLDAQPHAAIGRWVRAWEQLPVAVQRRLALEHDEDVSLGVALRIHAATGVPLVFDHLHFCLHNPERWSLPEALAVALATWPHDRRPKLHFASPRTELRAIEKVDTNQRHRWVLRAPRPGHHADFIHPWEFATFVRALARERDCDVMLEAKAADVALLRLRHDLQRYVPDVADLIQPAAPVRRVREARGRYAAA